VSKFPFHTKEWGSALYTVILENFHTKVGLKVLFRIPSIWEKFSTFCWISFSFLQEISEHKHLKCFTCCNYSFSTMILNLTVSCPKNAIFSEFSGDIYIPKFLLCCVIWILLSVKYPLNQLLWHDCLRKGECLFLYWLLQNTSVKRLKFVTPTIGLLSGRLVTRPKELSIAFNPQCKANRTASRYHISID
jgi:hypothetical protein